MRLRGVPSGALCCRCKKTPRRVSRFGYENNYCLPCANEKAKEWYHRSAKNRRLVQNRKLRHLYGITFKEKTARFEKQRRKCAACGSKKSGYKSARRVGVSSWHVDHNHATKQVRGIVCQRCNITMGGAQDSISRLRACADYLESRQ